MSTKLSDMNEILQESKNNAETEAEVLKVFNEALANLEKIWAKQSQQTNFSLEIGSFSDHNDPNLPTHFEYDEEKDENLNPNKKVNAKRLIPPSPLGFLKTPIFFPSEEALFLLQMQANLDNLKRKHKKVKRNPSPNPG